MLLGVEIIKACYKQFEIIYKKVKPDLNWFMAASEINPKQANKLLMSL